MKNKWTLLIIFLLIISITSGILLSKMSLIGQIGISTFYTQYSFLKNWYMSAALIFLSLTLFTALLWICKRTLSYRNFTIINLILLILALIGFFYTYYDFTSSSLKYLNNKFHMGAYLFWATCLLLNISFFIIRVKPTKNPKPQPNTNQHTPPTQ